MGIQELLHEKREVILQLAAKYGAQRVRVFGSVARGEARPDSDIDLLVDMPADHSLLDRIALLQDLEEMLKRKVDVATERVLRPDIRERVLREAIPL